MGDYPISMAELEKRFAAQEACLNYLAGLRWPSGYVCPRCVSAKGWEMENGLILCAGCRHQQSVIAGTVFQDTHMPLPTWFRAMWHVCANMNGMSAQNLQRLLGLRSYNTAWLCLHKLRRAMVRPGRECLSGGSWRRTKRTWAGRERGKAGAARSASRSCSSRRKCAAMRRGDCCLLSWEDVDLKEGFVTVKTSKTGETVDIPMFPMLRDLLTAAYLEAKAALPQRKPGQGAQPEPEGFVFPEQAAMYQKTPDGITWRVKKVITEAFKLKAVAAGDIFPEADPEEVRRKAHAYLDSLGGFERAARMRQTFDLYMTGLNIDAVAAQTGQKKPTISNHLNEIEDAIKLAFIRGKTRLSKKDALQKERAEGKGERRASVRDFHSFRVTWITLALTAGVPLELVQRVTGHRTVDVVLKHYFRPGREDFKQRILAAMPSLLVGPVEIKSVEACSASAKLEAALASLEGLSKEELEKLGARMKEMMGK